MIGPAVDVPEGTVQIGASEGHLDDVAADQHYDRDWFEDEAPQHETAVPGFAIDRLLVTNADFAAFADATGHTTAAERRGFALVYGDGYWVEEDGACWRHPAGPADSVAERMDHPVVQVTAADAAAYARWRGKRLPAEAEWEYAAHGPAWRCWPWGDDWDRERCCCAEYWAGQSISDFAAWRSWWRDRRAQHGPQPGTMPVGAFSPAGDSPFGVADMAGNVAEWTATPYHMYDADRAYDEVYQAAATARYLVVRGGGWMNFRHQLRTTERIAVDPGYASFAVGFRCAAR
jgi:sulfatase modifying factor 1